MARERIAIIKHLRYTCRQTIKSQAHADRMTGQIHLRHPAPSESRQAPQHAQDTPQRPLIDERIHPKTRPTWQVDLDHPRAFVHRRARIRTAILRRLPHQQSGRIEPPNCTFVLRLHNRADRKKPIRRTSGRCIGLCLLCRQEDASEVSAVGRVPITFRQLNT